MKNLFLTFLTALLLAGLSLAQDTTTPASAPPQDQQSPAATPDAQGAPQTAPPAAQQAQPRPAPVQTPNQPGAMSPANNSPKIAPGSIIPVQLTKGVDAKKAKTGDEVVAKVTQDMKTNSGEVIVPKDTRMIGHVTEAQARSKEQKESQVGISFDRALMKNGSELQVPMSIQAIIAQPSNNPASGSGGEGSYDQPAAAPAANSNGAGRNPNMAGSNPQPAAAPSATGSNEPSDAQSGTAPRPQITAQTQGVVGISNLTLSPTPDPAKGSVVSSDKNNVKLDSGLLLLLRVNQ